jgi:hypothetical protein
VKLRYRSGPYSRAELSLRASLRAFHQAMHEPPNSFGGFFNVRSARRLKRKNRPDRSGRFFMFNRQQPDYSAAGAFSPARS